MRERWSAIGQLFEAALDRPPGERIPWLEATCADPPLRAEVERLLKAHERADGILDAPARSASERPDESEHRIGPYRVVRELGRGGTSVVYLAEREAPFRRRVALKLLRPGFAASDLVRRFVVERQILATLDHPGIARLLDGGVSGTGRPYFVMELVEGQPLTDYCDAYRLPISARLALFRRVCDAVAYAHRHLVVHRDLKPSNIFVNDSGSPRLLDFGIAKLLDPAALPVAAPLTRAGVRPMTPEYASPEQLRGEPIETATDVYALGVILYELLAGRRPYQTDGRSLGEIERLVCEHEPLPPSRVAAQGDASDERAQRRGVSARVLQRTLRGDLDTIVRKALRVDPTRRYDSAEQFGADIERYRSRRPVIARPDTVGYRLRKLAQRHRWAVVAAATFVMLLAGYAATVTLQSLRIAEERDRARVETMKTVHVRDMLVELLASVGTGTRDTAALTEVLDGGAERLRRDLADHPAIRAEMLSALGDVYERLRRYEAARPLLEQALAARRTLFDEPHAEVAAALGDLAALEQHARRPGRAEALYREALGQLQAVRGEGDVAVAQAQHDLAALLAAEGRSAAARALYAEALPVYRRVMGSAHGQTAGLLTSLGALVCEAGDDRAAALYREALALERERLGGPHEQLATIHGDLGDCLVRLGRYEEAEHHLVAGLDLLRAVQGDPSSERLENLRTPLVSLYETWSKPARGRAYEARTPSGTAD